MGVAGLATAAAAAASTGAGAAAGASTGAGRRHPQLDFAWAGRRLS